MLDGNATIGNQSTDSHTFNGSVDLNHTLNVDGDADFNNPTSQIQRQIRLEIQILVLYKLMVVLVLTVI